ncbi:reverse transcriptase-like protein [Pedobacter sp.]|nr:reverse transcriptase-like protein [Candidatus Saccharibacteria bacterium]
MKQKVVTKAIIKQDGKILLLRRSGGRPSIAGKYELPGGRVHINQQPEDALAHALRIHLRVSPETMQLDDVMTYIDPADRELQYLFVLFHVSLKSSDRTISLSNEYDHYIWKRLSDIQRDEVTQSTQQQLGLQPAMLSTERAERIVALNDVKHAAYHRVIAYSDGGSRGNPGPSSAGYVLMDAAETVIFEGGAYLGITTNNVAEYQALYLGLQKALELGATVVDFRLDSLMVVNQMNGIYKVKNVELIPINHRINELASRFERVTFTHVRREYNRLADAMVNKILDQHENEPLPELSSAL